MSRRYHNILISYDGSEFSKNALTEATMISKAFGSKILLLNVVNETMFREQSPSLFTGYLQEVTNVEESITNNIIEQKNSLLQRLCFDLKKEDISASSHVIFGHPKKKILEFAKSHKIDLIIMGSQGLGGIKNSRSWEVSVDGLLRIQKSQSW